MTSTSELSLIHVQLQDRDLFSAIMELDQSEFTRPWTNESWNGALESSLKCIHALVRDGELIGHCLWQISKPDELAHLLKIQVIKKSRGLGLGFYLLAESEKMLEKMGFTRFYLEVESENEGAIALYKKSSYVVVHGKKSYYDDGKDALFMNKELETE